MTTRPGTPWKALVPALAVLALLLIFGSTSSQLFGDDTAAELSSLPKLEPEQVLRTPGPVTKLVWSSDGTKLAAAVIDAGPPILFTGFRTGAFGNLIMVWEANGRISRELRRQQSFFAVSDDFAFVAGDKQIVAPALYSSNTLAFSVFDLDSGEIVREIAGPFPDGTRFVNRARRLVASPDQSILAVAFQSAQQPMAFYSTHDWSRLVDLPDVSKRPLTPHAATFSSDGRSLAVIRSSTVFIYETASTEIVQTIGSTFDAGYGFPSAAALSPDGSMVAVALRGFFTKGTGEIVLTNNDAIGVFSTRDGSRVAFHDKVSTALALAWSPTDTLAFITRYKTLHLRDPLKTEPKERVRELSSALTLALSPDGSKLAVNDGWNVRVFRIVK